MSDQEEKTLKLVLCEECANEISRGDTILWSECLLCSCRTMKAEVTAAAILRQQGQRLRETLQRVDSEVGGMIFTDKTGKKMLLREWLGIDATLREGG